MSSIQRISSIHELFPCIFQVLPFPRDVVAQLDYNSRLRLTLCFFRLKTLMENGKIDREMNDRKTWSGKCKDVVSYRPALYNIGMLQNLMTEVRREGGRRGEGRRGQMGRGRGRGEGGGRGGGRWERKRKERGRRKRGGKGGGTDGRERGRREGGGRGEGRGGQMGGKEGGEREDEEGR